MPRHCGARWSRPACITAMATTPVAPVPDPPRLLPSGCQGQHGSAPPVPRWRRAHQRCTPLAAAGAGPAAGAQSAADMGISRPGDRALSTPGRAGLGSLALPHWPWTGPGSPSSPREACACPFLPVRLPHGLGNGTRLAGLNDLQRMGHVEGLDHLDAKALVSAEQHRVVDGASSSALLLGSHAGPRTPAPGE